MRNYVKVDPAMGYPAGDSMFYECIKCGTVLPSKPSENIGCACGNIFIDVEWGRIAVSDHSQFQAFVTPEVDSASKKN